MILPITQVGRYRVSSLSTALADGGFRAGVSIRSGSGSASTDRVLRFVGRFASEAEALDHGHHQGLMWVAHHDRSGATA